MENIKQESTFYPHSPPLKKSAQIQLLKERYKDQIEFWKEEALKENRSPKPSATIVSMCTTRVALYEEVLTILNLIQK